jgi:hypothetical protein
MEEIFSEFRTRELEEGSDDAASFAIALHCVSHRAFFCSGGLHPTGPGGHAAVGQDARSARRAVARERASQLLLGGAGWSQYVANNMCVRRNMW